MSSASSHSNCCVRRLKLVFSSPVSRPCATTRLPFNIVPASRSRHHAMLSVPNFAIRGSALSRKCTAPRRQHAARHTEEQLEAPSCLATIDYFDVGAALRGSQQRRPTLPDAGAYNGDLHGSTVLRRRHVDLTTYRARTSPTSPLHALLLGLRTHLVRNSHGAELPGRTWSRSARPCAPPSAAY